eukprot:3537223-Karenia_brevis.AAC.1
MHISFSAPAGWPGAVREKMQSLPRHRLACAAGRFLAMRSWSFFAASAASLASRRAFLSACSR